MFHDAIVGLVLFKQREQLTVVLRFPACSSHSFHHDKVVSIIVFTPDENQRNLRAFCC
jgi:hypothetical protein